MTPNPITDWMFHVAEIVVGFIGFGALLFAALGIYFLPTIIAHHRCHHNKVPILLVNLFTGWMFLGWFVALVWAFTNEPVNRRA